MSNGGSHRHSAERTDNFRQKEKKRTIEIGKQAAEASRGLFSPEDWNCLKCGNVNWARRQTCNMCNQPKHNNDMEERTGYGGGYNDRGVVEYKERQESDDEFDEFGRRRKKPRSSNGDKNVEVSKGQAEDNNKEDDEEESEEEDDGDISKYKLFDDDDEELEKPTSPAKPVKSDPSPKRSRTQSSSSSSSSTSDSSSSSSTSTSSSDSHSSGYRRRNRSRSRERSRSDRSHNRPRTRSRSRSRRRSTSRSRSNGRERREYTRRR